MQKIQILRGTPNPTFKVTSADLARLLALDRIYKNNLITNGDMEIDDNWASYGTPAANSQSTVKVITGDNSRLLTPNASNEGIQGDVFTTATDEVIRHHFMVYPDDGTVVSVIVQKGDDSGILLAKTFTGLTQDAWNTVIFDVKEIAGGAGAYLVLHSGAQTSGDFYIANVFSSKLNGARQYVARKATGAIITLEDNDIRWAVGGTVPTMAATAKLGHLQADPARVVLDNFDAVKDFRYVSNVTGTAGILNVSVEF